MQLLAAGRWLHRGWQSAYDGIIAGLRAEAPSPVRTMANGTARVSSELVECVE